MSESNVFKIKQYNYEIHNPKNLQKNLTKTKFEENLPPPVKEAGFFLCNDSIYHRCGYFKQCESFQFKVKSMI